MPGKGLDENTPVKIRPVKGKIYRFASKIHPVKWGKREKYSCFGNPRKIQPDEGKLVKNERGD